MAEAIVRTRFAPSPTGIMHIGNLRSALYEYLIARVAGGHFILRIEDTDRERLVDGAVEAIYKTLRTCGIQHDEGPDIGGPSSPYVQSERLPIYRRYANDLVKQGDAYPCFCSIERLASLHEEQTGDDFIGYDRHCREIDPEESAARIEKGEPYVIRQKMPLQGETSFTDAVYGTITVDNKTLEDQVLIKSDGYPTYNFANVIDDHLMGITHVVRGSEYLSSTPKYNLLYEAFDWGIPVYVHLPLIVGEDGRKLSKRHGATSFDELIEAGYLPEAIINMIAFLGWSPGNTTREDFTLEELESAFTISGISKAPAVFSYNKLDWMNEQYIKNLPDHIWLEMVKEKADPLFKDQPYNTAMLARVLKERTTRLSDIPDTIAFMVETPTYTRDLFKLKRAKLNAEKAADILAALIPDMEALQSWDEVSIHDLFEEAIVTQNRKKGEIMGAVRLALSGRTVTPGGAIELAVILGRDVSLSHMKNALDFLNETDVASKSN
ncbi:MAG: glutamate--tRNA ligase [Clostridiaceae bacterium]|nr:glutamate--tRNA ligase [Clostridiaceae bacterium]